jgi:hypothetical protein
MRVRVRDSQCKHRHSKRECSKSIHGKGYSANTETNDANAKSNTNTNPYTKSDAKPNTDPVAYAESNTDPYTKSDAKPDPNAAISNTVAYPGATGFALI